MKSGSVSLPLRGLVLAGGAARRLAGKKASRLLDGQTWLERAAVQLRPHCESVYVSVRSSAEPIPDWSTRLLDVDHAGPSQGPLAALHALANQESCDACVLACDYPLLSGDVVEALLRRARSASAPVLTLAVAADGQRHPLVAFWPAAALQHAAELYEQGERAIHRVTAALKVQELAVEGDLLLNVNRPEDLLLLEAALGRGDSAP